MSVLKNKVLAILKEQQELQQRAFFVLHSICKKHDGKVVLDSNIAIDFDLGFHGCEMCNIYSLYLSEEDKLCAKVYTCDIGLSCEVEISSTDAVEILSIICSDAHHL